MLRLLLHWILNALALLVVSHFVDGFVVSNVVSAFIAVVVIGLLNATLGLFLKIITLPLGILTFGLFFLLINAKGNSHFPDSLSGRDPAFATATHRQACYAHRALPPP